ncbi:hypothetical protein ES692_02810 [Psychroserpens burtonensis]|uniref:Polyphosphate kinase-2-related domain-containing protein n=1 Tax=Psychroserpens burtonensis TaxID=49278 RepID=A0A5C7BK07_9FLAO|nr:hypothetical protein ES692_02810 [Psychroserpens burtonensis]
MSQINEFEKMIQESGIHLIKLYFSITKTEQERHFKDILNSPIKKWKYSNIDKKLRCFGTNTQSIKRLYLKTLKNMHHGRLLKLIEKRMQE